MNKMEIMLRKLKRTTPDITARGAVVYFWSMRRSLDLRDEINRHFTR